ncbi:MAG: formylglycine-generating enzyme family protein [Alphaproteobacteria bacterium]
MEDSETLWRNFLDSCDDLINQDRRCRNYFPEKGGTLDLIADAVRLLQGVRINGHCLPAFSREYDRLLELRADLPRAEEHDLLDGDPPPANDYLAKLDRVLADLATVIHTFPLEERQDARPETRLPLVEGAAEQPAIVPMVESAQAGLTVAEALKQALDSRNDGVSLPPNVIFKIEIAGITNKILPGIALDFNVVLRDLLAPLVNLNWIARIGRSLEYGVSLLDAGLAGIGHLAESVRRLGNVLLDEVASLAGKLRLWLRKKKVPESAIVPEPKRLLEPLPGLRLLPIPAGKFMMGSEEGRENEKPVHSVRVSAFLLAETPVTNGQYGMFLKETKREKRTRWHVQKSSDSDQPVVEVDWYDAVAFCKWLSKTSGLSCRLPSEAEWEYAARGTDGRRYPWGNGEPTENHACYGLKASEGKPAKVGSFPAGRGPFGTLDQAGLVWEWCADFWHDNYEGAPSDNRVWIAEGVLGDRVVRGGDWCTAPTFLRATHRVRLTDISRGRDFGFRVAADPVSHGPTPVS